MRDKKGKLVTKIIAGKLKGKNIELPSLEVTRSSKTVLRESLFNTLQFDIIDTTFVEVFAGSGSIGIEAISRGAKSIYFLEKDTDSFKVLKNNIKSLNILNARAILGDSFERLSEVISELKRDKTEAYFYFDPPFSYRDSMNDIYEKSLKFIKSIPIEIIKEVIIEHMSFLDLPKEIGQLELKKKKKFGKSSISYYISKKGLDAK